jgi:hypothetical protein
MMVARMTKPERVLVSVDANTVIHFYRAGIFTEPGEVLEGVIDTLVCNEIQHHAPDIYLDFLHVDRMGLWLREVKQNELNSCQIALFNNSWTNNHILFNPKDRGEVRAIALGHALGATALLTDDTKKSGPRDFILKGFIEAIDTISFWETLLMLYLIGQYDALALKRFFEQVRQKGYDPLPKLDFRIEMSQSIERLSKAAWFQKWLHDCDIKGIDQKQKILRA